MAEEMDLKLQEIKNAIYFMAETIEKHYMEQTQKIDVLAETIDKLAGGAPITARAISVPSAPALPSKDFAELKEKIEELGEKISAAPSKPSKDFSGIEEKLDELSEKISSLPVTKGVPAAAAGDNTVIKSLDLIAEHMIELKKSMEPLEAVNFRKLVLTIEKLASSSPGAAAMSVPVSAAASPEMEKEVVEVLVQVKELKKQNAAVAEACALIIGQLEQLENSLGAKQ